MTLIVVGIVPPSLIMVRISSRSYTMQSVCSVSCPVLGWRYTRYFITSFIVVARTGQETGDRRRLQVFSKYKTRGRKVDGGGGDKTSRVSGLVPQID